MGELINLFGNSTNLDRRVFIKGTGAVSLGLVAALGLGGCEEIFEQIRNRPTRRRLRTGSPEVDNDIAIYTDGVAQMKALPANNPRSWAAQAAIHGTVAGGFNFCQHGGDHFFSWHRAYLYYFERIIRNLTGETQWGLPYWNWNQDPVMHPSFTAAGSTLNHPRTVTDLSGYIEFEDDTLDPMFGDPDFFAFGGQIEGTPHNLAHVYIGRDMVSGGSPRDPIFWMHHNMVDYCWWKWNIELENSSPGDAAWQNTTWNHFVDENGDPAEMSALGTAIMPLLSYQFETSTIGSFAHHDARTERFASLPSRRMASFGVLGAQATPPTPKGAVAPELKDLEQRLRKGATIREEVLERVQVANRAELILARPLSLTTNFRAAGLTEKLTSSKNGERTFLRIRHAEMPETSDFFIRVYLNMPEANAQTSTKDPHYAGSYAFFGTRADHPEGHKGSHGKTDFLINISNAVERLTREGVLGANETLSVQLVAVPAPKQRIAKPESRLRINAVEISLSRAIVELIK